MMIARVIGELTATLKDPSHEGQKILLVQPLELNGAPRGNPVVALDAFSAGMGDLVLLTTEGFCAFSSVGKGLSPIDAAVLGIIDHVELVEGVCTGAPLGAVQPPDQQRPGQHFEDLDP